MQDHINNKQKEPKHLQGRKTLGDFTSKNIWNKL